ncbi:MAG: diacylglycerol kinase family lipid kinase [Candidatus Omnitrophota bacterium]|nr:diacylglycerol kinase family lipid kinase [Candidatus Omnitrophota bacterium]
MSSPTGKKIKNIHIIINPGSGKGESILPVINASMKEAGITWEASITHKAGDAIHLAKTAVQKGIDALAVYGGDGTVMEAVSGLIGSEVPLIILPGGSANVMANELGIPKDLKEACALISQSPVEMRTFDVGHFNNLYFITGISIGFGADVVKGTNREAKNRFGILAYFFSAAEALKRLKLARYHFKIDGKKYEAQGLTCMISNAGNLGFSKISLDKHIDVNDGLLDVVVVRKANLNLFKLIIVTLLKRERPDNYELVGHWQGKDISLSSSHKQVVQCDGETLDKIPSRIKIIPAAIQVLVPKKENKPIK